MAQFGAGYPEGPPTNYRPQQQQQQHYPNDELDYPSEGGYQQQNGYPPEAGYANANANANGYGQPAAQEGYGYAAEPPMQQQQNSDAFSYRGAREEAQENSETNSSPPSESPWYWSKLGMVVRFRGTIQDLSKGIEPEIELLSGDADIAKRVFKDYEVVNNTWTPDKYKGSKKKDKKKSKKKAAVAAEDVSYVLGGVKVLTEHTDFVCSLRQTMTCKKTGERSARAVFSNGTIGSTALLETLSEKGKKALGKYPKLLDAAATGSFDLGVIPLGNSGKSLVPFDVGNLAFMFIQMYRTDNGMPTNIDRVEGQWISEDTKVVDAAVEYIRKDIVGNLRMNEHLRMKLHCQDWRVHPEDEVSAELPLEVGDKFTTDASRGILNTKKFCLQQQIELEVRAVTIKKDVE